MREAHQSQQLICTRTGTQLVGNGIHTRCSCTVRGRAAILLCARRCDQSAVWGAKRPARHQARRNAGVKRAPRATAAGLLVEVACTGRADIRRKGRERCGGCCATGAAWQQGDDAKQPEGGGGGAPHLSCDVYAACRASLQRYIPICWHRLDPCIL